MNIQMIPLNRLTPSMANVRKTGGTAIDDLAASIAAHGLLQNLQVRPTAKGKYEVIAGGRRLKALNLLAKHKTIAKTFEVGCNVLDGDNATEVSLAENIIREAMHPADQFDAFQAMAAAGASADDIAARFGCAPSAVKQRLKLGGVNPALIRLYRDGEMSLQELMAFTVSDDHAAQMECWQSLPHWNRSAGQIRDTLMAAHVGAGDPRVKFIGLDAYVAAGGAVVRDLFDAKHEGYLANVALLDRLVAGRLESEAAKARAEGWSWVEIHPTHDHAHLNGFEELEGTDVPLTDAEAAELTRAEAEIDALMDAPESDETNERLETLWDRVNALRDVRPFVWSDDDKAMAGVVVTMSARGELYVIHGLVRASERKALEGRREGTALADTKTAPQPKGLSAKLVEELTAHRTAALQFMVARNVPVAIAALAETLALPLFYNGSGDTSLCLNGTRMDVRRRFHSESLTGCKAADAFDALMADWKERLPADAEALPTWLTEQGAETCLALISVCAAASLNAVKTANDLSTRRRVAHADRLASSVGLDMAAWWQPTAATYLARVPKTLALDAVAEAKSRQAADNIAGLKKDALVAKAEALLAGTGWLPAPLRQAE